MKHAFFITLGVLLSMALIAYFVLFHTSFNAFSRQYHIKGKIENYSSILEDKPTEAVLEISLGNPLHWEEKTRCLVYKIEPDGSFNIKATGYNLILFFRSDMYDYYHIPITKKNNTLSVELEKLKKTQRYFNDEENKRDSYIYQFNNKQNDLQ